MTDTFLQVTGFDPLVVENTTAGPVGPQGAIGPQGPTGATGPAGGVNSIDGQQGAVVLSGTYLKLSGSTTTTGFKIIDPSDSSTEWNFYRSGGVTAFTINGKAGYPADLVLFAPNGTDYADFTFDGSNTEIDASVGNISLRPLSGGNVNIWATSGTPKLRVGSTNMAQSLDITHDGTNAHLNNTTTGYVGLQADKFQVLTDGTPNLSGPTSASATAGTNGAVPSQVYGYVNAQIGGVAVRIPYFKP